MGNKDKDPLDAKIYGGPYNFTVRHLILVMVFSATPMGENILARMGITTNKSAELVQILDATNKRLSQVEVSLSDLKKKVDHMDSRFSVNFSEK